MSMTLDDGLDQVRRFIEKKCVTGFSEEPMPAWVFDWRSVAPEVAGEFLEDTFCDGFVDGYLDTDDSGMTRWAHETHVPFALINWDGDPDAPFDGQFDAILLLDLGSAADGDCPVLAIEVDGTAMPDNEPGPVTTLRSLGLSEG